MLGIIEKSKLGAVLLGSLVAMTLGASPSDAARGTDGELRLIYWQAPSTLNPYLSGGTKDTQAASMMLESLARYDENGNLVPWLAKEIPTVANGGVTTDYKTIVWNLREGVVWSDGSPFTSADVVFSYEYCTHPEGGCAQSQKYQGINSVVPIDDVTVAINFDQATPYPYEPFVGVESPILQRAQFANCLGARGSTCADENFGPIGTGPFVVTEFKPNDVIRLEANQLFRDPSKPHFATVVMKGGGSAEASARAVMQTGEYDYGWNLQLAPDVIAQMELGGKGIAHAGFGSLVERLMVNFTDPSPARGDLRSTTAHPHPFLSDIAVRKALSLAIDRELLVEIGYGKAGRVTCNVVPAPELYASIANDGCRVRDVEGANSLLDNAGWTRDSDGIRSKDGVRLSILYQTSTNAVRQDFQALVKDFWAEIGVETELRNLSGSVFFGGDASSPDTFQKFFADIEMYANKFTGTDPQSYLNNWRCNTHPRPESQWQGPNIPRYCNPEVDSLLDELANTADLDSRGEIGRAINDILMQDYVMIPLVYRGDVSGVSNSLGGVRMNVWDSELWNIADWYRKDS